MWLKSLLFGIVIAGASSALANSHEPLSDGVVSLRVGVTTPTIPLSLQSASNSSKPPLLYDQNSNSKFGVGLDYSWFGFFVSVSDLQNDAPSATYGEASYSDFQLHTYFGSLGIDMYMQDFKGYYLSNTQAVTGDTSCCLLRPDLRSRFLGVNIMWVLSPDRLSMQSTGSFLGVQKRSGGSWMLFAGGSAQEFMSDSTLAPAGLEGEYGLLGGAQRARFTLYTLGPGYGYTGMITDSFFFHVSGLFGFGPQHQEVVTRSAGSRDLWNIANKTSLRSTLGWSGARTFGGLQLIYDFTNFKLEEEALGFSSVLVFLSAGVRFGL